MQPSRWGYFITIIGAGITPGSAWRRSAWRPLRANARRYLSMSPRWQVLAGTGGQSAVNPEDVAAALDVLASRVRRMPPPIRAGDPDRFYEEQSEIAHDLAKLARRIAPRTGRTTPVEVDIADGRRGRVVVSSMTVNGRRVVAQKRQAFTVHVGERPVKKD